MDSKNIVQKALKNINADWLFQKAKAVKPEDFQRILKNITKIYDKIKDDKHFKDLISDISIMFEMIKDYVQGRYKEIPFNTIAGLAFALLYVLNPFDLIPDFIPGIGYVDDAAVVILAIKLFRKDIENYRTWKSETASFTEVKS